MTGWPFSSQIFTFFLNWRSPTFKRRHQDRNSVTIIWILSPALGQGSLANNLANFELTNPNLVGEPNFNLANTNEYFAHQNKIWRTEMRLGELHFELRELQNFYLVKFSNDRSKIKVIILARLKWSRSTDILWFLWYIWILKKFSRLLIHWWYP